MNSFDDQGESLYMKICEYNGCQKEAVAEVLHFTGEYWDIAHQVDKVITVYICEDHKGEF